LSVSFGVEGLLLRPPCTLFPPFASLVHLVLALRNNISRFKKNKKGSKLSRWMFSSFTRLEPDTLFKRNKLYD